MHIPLRNGEEMEVPQDWIDEWNQLYYDIPRTLHDIRIWCLDNPEKRKTRRGFRAFLGRWIRRACTKKPVAQEQKRPEVFVAPESLETRLNHLADLKSALKRGETP